MAFTKTSDGTYHEYIWDFRGRLRAIDGYTAAGVWMTTTTYTYDALDRRISKINNFNGPANPSNDERYSYDGSDLVLAFGYDFMGTRYLKHRHMYGAQDGAAMTQENAATGYVLWLLADHQGTIRTVTDGNQPEAGTTLNFITYDSFGNILPGSATPARFARNGYWIIRFQRCND